VIAPNPNGKVRRSNSCHHLKKEDPDIFSKRKDYLLLLIKAIVSYADKDAIGLTNVHLESKRQKSNLLICFLHHIIQLNGN